MAHTPGRANYATDFLSRIQLYRGATLFLKLSNKIPIKEIEIDTTAETPNVSLNSIKCIADQIENQKLDPIFVEQYNICGLY